MTSSAALAKQVIIESESSNPRDWAQSLFSKISSLPGPDQSAILLDICKSYCSQVNARTRSIKLRVDDLEEEIEIPFDFEADEGMGMPLPAEVVRREKRFLKFLTLWRTNLEQRYHHPVLGMSFVRDLTLNQLIEVSLYQKEKIAQSVARNEKFDDFIASLPMSKADVPLGEYTNEEAVAIAQSWDPSSTMLIRK